jgi:hypothetical protein
MKIDDHITHITKDIIQLIDVPLLCNADIDEVPDYIFKGIYEIVQFTNDT